MVSSEHVSSKMERGLAYFANRLTSEEKEELAISEPAIRDAMEAENIFNAGIHLKRWGRWQSCRRQSYGRWRRSMGLRFCSDM